MKRLFIASIGIVFALMSGSVLAQDQLDAETQRLWDAHTIVPKTDDIKQLRAFLQYGSDNWTQMNGRIHGEETWKWFHEEFI